MRHSALPPAAALRPSSPRATPPPLSPSGIKPSCDKAGASTLTPPPAPGDSSTGQPLRREDSETRFEIALSKLENYLQAMKDNNIKITDPRVVEKLAVLIDKMIKKLPRELQEQVRAELSAKIFQGPQVGRVGPKVDTRKKLVGWIREKIFRIFLLIGLGLLMFIISRYSTV